MDQIVVSDSNRTPVVQIVTWLCLVVSILAFFTHAGIKLYASRSLGVETILVFLSLVWRSSGGVYEAYHPTGFRQRPVDLRIITDFIWLW
jgi:hypothetical protein